MVWQGELRRCPGETKRYATYNFGPESRYLLIIWADRDLVVQPFRMDARSKQSAIRSMHRRADASGGSASSACWGAIARRSMRESAQSRARARCDRRSSGARLGAWPWAPMIPGRSETERSAAMAPGACAARGRTSMSTREQPLLAAQDRRTRSALTSCSQVPPFDQGASGHGAVDIGGVAGSYCQGVGDAGFRKRVSVSFSPSLNLTP